MQFHIRVAGCPSAAVDRFAAAMTALDPAAITDRAGALLRVATCLPQHEVRAICGSAGLVLGDGDLEQLPSECCGGCGG